MLPQPVLAVLPAQRNAPFYLRAAGSLQLPISLIERVEEASDLPVMAELPFAFGFVSESRKKQPPLIPVSLYRAVPDISLARGILAGGGLGDLRHFQIALRLADAGDDAPREPFGPRRLVDELAAAAFDLAFYCFGEPSDFRAGYQAASGAVREQVHLQLGYRSDVEGELVLGAGNNPAYPFLLSAVGTEGRLDVGWRGSYYRPTGGKLTRIGQGFEPEQACANLLALSMDILSGEAQPWIPWPYCERVFAWTGKAAQALASEADPAAALVASAA